MVYRSQTTKMNDSQLQANAMKKNQVQPSRDPIVSMKVTKGQVQASRDPIS